MVTPPHSAPLRVFISAPADVGPLRAFGRTVARLTLALLSDARMREVFLPRGNSRKAPWRPEAPAGDVYLTREEAAARLGETPKTLANWHGLPGKPQRSKLAGRRAWYLKSVIDRYDAELRGVPPSPDPHQPSTKLPLRRGPGRPKKKI